jgi:hypothetical protein
VRAQRAAHDDDEAGQGEQRDRGAGGAARRVKIAFGEREHGRGGQQIPDEERHLADDQGGDGRERAEPGPPGERAHDAPGHKRDRPQIAEWHQEPPAMRDRMRDGRPRAAAPA